jgi:FKBP-type peptidyl-prolyl cis-trans isomerase
MTDHDPKLTGRLHEDKPRRPRPDLSQHRTWLLALARRPQVVVPVALVLGALVGAGVVAAATPAATATSEYQALEARLDRAVEAKDEDLAEQRAQIRDLRVEKGELEAAASDVKRQQLAADARDAELATRESAVGAAEASKKASQFSDGVHIVGTTVAAGVYSISSSDSCYYVWRTGTGSDSEIVDNHIVSGPATVTLRDGEVFETSRCGTWNKVG